MLELTKENFEKEVLKAKEPVLVDFWANWCGPCLRLAPVLDRLSDEFKNKLKFAKLDVEKAKEVSAQYSVRGIPCLIVFKYGKEVDRIIGFYPEEQLRKKIDLALTKV